MAALETTYETDHHGEHAQPQARDNKKTDDEQVRLWQLYQEQQARRACPGCAEEAFLG